jgi:hypothetical protein
MADKHDFAETVLLRTINPGGDVSRFFTGDPPITAASDSFVSPPREYISKIVHPRIAAYACVAALHEGPPDGHIGRTIEIDPPSMNPNDGHWFR